MLTIELDSVVRSHSHRPGLSVPVLNSTRVKLPGILCCIGESQCQSDARFDPCLKHCNLQTAFGLTTIAMTNCTFAQHADADPLLGTQLNALSSESSVIVLLRLWVLWDRDRIAVAVTVFAFVLTNVVSLGMLIFMITRVYGE